MNSADKPVSIKLMAADWDNAGAVLLRMLTGPGEHGMTEEEHSAVLSLLIAIQREGMRKEPEGGSADLDLRRVGSPTFGGGVVKKAQYAGTYGMSQARLRMALLKAEE